MAGGTGGHVFPALAVAKKLEQEGWSIHWLGTEDRMESVLVPKYGIPISYIKIKGIKGSGIINKLCAPIKILRAVFQAKRIIKQINPNVALGMGGYVSGPGGIAAKWLSIPLVLHEQNGVAGLTNQWLAKTAATKVLQAFPTAFKDADVVGNPVREELKSIDLPEQRMNNRTDTIRLLIMGGSQGAKILNDTMPKAINQFEKTFSVWHQAGKGNANQVEQSYDHQLNQIRVTEFIDDMKEAYEWADLVICRSGALTISELEVVGLGAICIPFMHKDRQQYWNAKPMETADAAIIIEQPDFTVERLSKELKLIDRAKTLKMAMNAKSLAIMDADERVASVIRQLAK